MMNFLLQKYRHYNLRRKLPKDDIKIQISSLLPKNPTILEAGGHVGFDTVQLAILFPKGIIHTFEPIPEIHKQLELNTQKFSNVFRHQKAFSNKSGVMSINVSKGGVDGSSSLLKPKKHTELFPDISFEESIEIDTICLDEWAKKEKIDSIDFMWLDMQGYELIALEAGKSILKTTKMVFMEVNLEELYEGCPLKKDVIAWMKNQGFEVLKEFFENGQVYGEILFSRVS